MAIKLLNSDAHSKCYTSDQINSAKGTIVKNTDGTVSVFMLNNVGVKTPISLGKLCCEALDPSFTFDVNTQTCRWNKISTCDFTSPINVNIFSNGDDGSLFLVDNDEKCDLKVSFDYIFKIKCESLYKVLFPTTTSNPKTLKEINGLDNQISELSVKAESIENQILLLDEQIKSTLYSVNCDSFPYSDVITIGTEVPTPIDETPVTSVKGNFGNTGFGNLTPMSMAKVRYYSVNFCITEPAGLSVWANILGEAKYQQFLAGDPASYTCNDVVNLYNQNVNGDLILVCTTPFGAKTELIKQKNALFNDLANVRNLETDLKIKSADLQATLTSTIIGCTTPIEALETLNISMGIDVMTNNTSENVFNETLLDIGVGNLYTYLTTLPAANNNNSGLYICGDPTKNDVGLSPCTVLSLNNGSFTPNVSSCTSIIQPLLNSLLSESQLSVDEFNTNIASNVFASGWVHYETLITDPTILSQIANKKIKLTLTINDTCVDVCVLLDNIVLDKTCTVVDTQKIEITQSPGFELSRVQDNKKSWVSKDSPTNREFLIAKSNGTSPIRQTDYDVNNERLVINTKEIDLNINIAGAIENDVWCYMVDNPCLLTGTTNCDPCAPICGNKSFQDDECFNFQDGFIYEFQDGVLVDTETGSQQCCGDNKIDFSNLLTSPLSAVTTIQGFENLLVSELIDVKNRKTISSYPTLRALYNRYMNSSDYCATNSSRFDYNTMDVFSNLVGGYWVDIIEQVIPATTIWGSIKIYSNTIFDDQKFRYRQYSTLICTNPFYGFNLPSPINGTTGMTQGIQIQTETIKLPSKEVYAKEKPIKPCNFIHNVQMNSGSEFIGTVTIIGEAPIEFIPIGCGKNSNFIGECNLVSNIDVDIRSTDNIVLTVNASNGSAPYTYLWNTNETTTSINGQGGTTYSCEITDSNCCKTVVRVTIPELTACVYVLPETPEFLMGSLYFDLFGTSPSCDGQADGFANTRMSIYDVTVNGTPLLTTPVLTDVNQVSVDWVQANNDLVYQCTLGQVTGQTYTNFVDLVNTVFDDLGLTYYKAQIAKIPRDVYDVYGYIERLNGFYIIRPSLDTFSIKADANTNVDKYIYTQNSVNDWQLNNNWSFQYPKFTCTGITINNSIVVE